MDLAANNNRACSRTPVSMDVTLVADQGVPFHGTLSNISFNGGYITTSHKALSPNTPVTLILQKDDGGVQRLYRMNATIVRLGSDGAGVAFDDFDTETVRSLRTIYKTTLGG